MARTKTPKTPETPEGEQRTTAGGCAASEPRRPDSKSCKDVYFAVLPDKYEPLLEELEEHEEQEVEEERRRRKAETRRKKREKYKKCRKNVGRALRWTWRCLVAGLQSLAGVYSAPFTATATLATVYSKA